MEEYLILIDPPDGPAAESYPTTLFQRKGATLSPIVNGTLHLSAAEIAEAARVLPGASSEAEVARSGSMLYQKLQGALSRNLDSVVNGATAQIHLQLPLGDLHSVPWEAMVWQKPGFAGTTASWVSQSHQLCRVFEPDWSAEAPATRGPIRILLAIGASRDDTINAAGEVEEIRRSLQVVHRTIDVDEIWPASKEELYERIRKFQPHVLHFIGHATGVPAELDFNTWSWTATAVSGHVGKAILNNWVPCLVFLNACRTATLEGSCTPMAGAFLQGGAKAALAMQGDIAGEEAGRLAGSFYAYVGNGVTINDALLTARQALAQSNKYKQAAMPALVLRLAPAVALPLFPAMDHSYTMRASTCDLLPALSSFMNQVESRRRIYGALWPPAPPPKTFVLIRGETGFGKTVLSTWVLDLGLRLGHRVRYVSLAESRGAVDYRRILALIWGEGAARSNSPLRDPLDAPADQKLLASLTDTAIPVDVVYGSFRLSLIEAAKLRPLTIVLDDFDRRMDKGSFWYLWKNLFVPIGRGAVPNVNLVVALREEEIQEFDFEGPNGELKLRREELWVPCQQVSIPAVERDEFVEQLPRYLSFLHEDLRLAKYQSDIRAIVAIAGKHEAARVPISRFKERAREIVSLIAPDLAGKLA
jgi:CHAT domain-containing protein